MPGTSTNPNRTETDAEAVSSAISGLPEVKEDLAGINLKITDVSDPLTATWIGTARDAYLLSVCHMQQQLDKIQTQIGVLHGTVLKACNDRITLDKHVAAAASSARYIR